MTLYHTITSYQFNDYLELNENQTAVIDIKIRDSVNNLYTPSILRWQLTDEDGNIINNRSFTIVQTVVDKVILDYDDTAITEGVDELILSIAAGVAISSVNVQQNSEIKIKLKDFTNSFPKLFGSTVSDTLDDPFRDLDSPFTNLDETF